MKMKKVLCLYRVSTLGQVDPKDDIPMQRRECEDFIARHSDWVYYGERLEKGVSGYKVSANKRDVILEIRAMAERKEFDVLLVFMFDRLGRREDETPFLVQWFIEHGIEVWSTREGQQRLDSQVDKLLNFIRFWQASGESAKTSVRVKAAHTQMTQDGIWRGGKCPYGYKLVRKGRTGKKNRELYDLEIDPVAGSQVQLIFEMAGRQGMGTTRIANYLNEHFPAPNKTWTRATVMTMLKNPVYTGRMHMNDVLSEPNETLRLVSDDDFQFTQYALKKRLQDRYTEVRREEDGRVPEGQTKTSVYGASMLSGLLWCGHCHHKLVGGYCTKHLPTHVYHRPIYRCYYVNMDTDEFIEFHTDDDSGVLAEARRGTDFFDRCKREVKLYVRPEDQAAFVRVVNREFLSEALAREKVYELPYRRIKGESSFYVRMRASRMEDDPRFIVIAVSDIDELMRQRRMEERIQEERVVYARLHAITGNFICVYVTDPETGHYREFSATPDYEESFAQAKGGADFFTTLRDAAKVYSHPADRDWVLSLLTQANVMAEIDRSGIFTLGYRIMMDGKPLHVQMKAAMVEEKEGPRLVVGLNDIDAQVRQEEEYGRRLAQAQTQANIDALTGVKNKHAYLVAEAQMDCRIAEHRQPPFAVVMLDVNDLKKVNDTEGHQAGDHYLRDACEIICDIFKHSPVFRIGGDEFAVISQGKDYARIEELLGKLAGHNAEASRTSGIVIACGMSKYEHDDCVATVFERADHNMYENKNALKSAVYGQYGGKS